jgi:hypothetical protein
VDEPDDIEDRLYKEYCEDPRLSSTISGFSPGDFGVLSGVVDDLLKVRRRGRSLF